MSLIIKIWHLKENQIQYVIRITLYAQYLKLEHLKYKH